MQVLLQKIRDHDDQQSFKQFYQLLFFRLYQFAYSYLQSKESAEEVVNDVFLGFWHKRKTLDTISNVNVYLYVSVKNASLNWLRKNRQLPPVSLDELAVGHMHLAPSPESLLITRELQTRVQEAIDQLPPRCKLIFKLIKEDGLSYKEVAAILDISVKTVDAQLCLAFRKLALILQPVWAENVATKATSLKNRD